MSAAGPARSGLSGRVRSLAEARAALRLPETPAGVKAAGVPAATVCAFPVADPDQPELVAEFAALVVLARQGGRLVERRAGQRLRYAQKSTALWVVYGALVQATDGALVISALAIGPAFAGQLTDRGDDVAVGVTAELLRLLSPTTLLGAAVEYLHRSRYWLQVAERLGAPVMPERQRRAFRRLERARLRRSALSEQQIAEIAKRYLALYRSGMRRPLPQLANEFGISREQARDRVRRAREFGYLTAGTPGRAGAEPGPRLHELGWQPPKSPPAEATER
jgi:hypothetical protein